VWLFQLFDQFILENIQELETIPDLAADSMDTDIDLELVPMPLDEPEFVEGDSVHQYTSRPARHRMINKLFIYTKVIWLAE